jgi:MoaA/NifB/PqqE/SkfB family radical SAM enzyme
MNKAEFINKLLWLGYTSTEEGTGKRKEAVSMAHNLLDEYLEAINYTRCCKSNSEQLPDVEKKQLIEDAYWLNLQNLSGREDFEEAFKLGIETGVDETLQKLHSL